MADDLVSKFLEELREAEPNVGYMAVWDGEDDEDGPATVQIDGWLYRDDLARILSRLVNESAPRA